MCALIESFFIIIAVALLVSPLLLLLYVASVSSLLQSEVLGVFFPLVVTRGWSEVCRSYCWKCYWSKASANCWVVGSTSTCETVA